MHCIVLRFSHTSIVKGVINYYSLFKKHSVMTVLCIVENNINSYC